MFAGRNLQDGRQEREKGHLFVEENVCLSVGSSVPLSVYLSVCMPTDSLKCLVLVVLFKVSRIGYNLPCSIPLQSALVFLFRVSAYDYISSLFRLSSEICLALLCSLFSLSISFLYLSFRVVCSFFRCLSFSVNFYLLHKVKCLLVSNFPLLFIKPPDVLYFLSLSVLKFVHLSIL